MNLPPVTRSLRFRLTGMTSGVVFGVGGLMLGLIYLAVLTGIRSLTTRVTVVAPVGDFVIKLGENEYRTVESFVKEEILNQVAVIILVVLLALFVASLVVGWVVASRALSPVDTITQVAAEIEATDLSRRIGMEGPDDELTRMARTFDSMLDRLDRAFKGQRELLAQTSHDLRTPLAIIRSNLDVTMSDPDAGIDEWRSTGTIALRASERMSGMIDDLLAAARMEAGAPTLVNVDLAVLVRQTAEELSARASEAGARLDVVAGSALVLGDRNALGRAVGNLVDNAINASPSGATVVVSSGRIGDWGYAAVFDRGPGVDAAVVRGERPARGHLGLVIVREICRLHGGSVDAAKRKGGGSVVAMWIPLGAGSGSDVPPMSALPVI